ncbi:MAG TPA: site-2 protease family protein [Anaerolineae bacterium]
MLNRQGITLGRIWGIPIEVDYSWFLAFILITWTLAVSYYPAEFNNWPAAQYWLVAAVTAVMLFASVLLHELGHSIIAIRYKIPVRRITLFIFGGVAQIGAEPPSARAEFWIAVAGPAVSLALVVIFRLLQFVLTGIAPLLALAEYLAYINGMLVLFNLIPGFPLDGGRVLRAIVWGISHSLSRATLIAATVGRAIAFLFILLGVWQMLSGNFGNGLWIAFIGWFLENAASAQIHQQMAHDLMADHQVAEAMSRDYATISPETTLQHLVDEHILGAGRRCLMVMQDDEPVGLLTLHNVKAVPQTEWPTTTAVQTMIPIKEVKRVRPDTELGEAMAKMDRNGVNQLPVMVDGHCLGMLSRGDLVDFIRTRRELGI